MCLTSVAVCDHGVIAGAARAGWSLDPWIFRSFQSLEAKHNRKHAVMRGQVRGADRKAQVILQ